MPFDTDSLVLARKSGYTDDEIYSHLSQKDERFAKAKAAGYTLDDVAAHFAQKQSSFASNLQTLATSPEASAIPVSDAITQQNQFYEATRLPGQPALIPGTVAPTIAEVHAEASKPVFGTIPYLPEKYENLISKIPTVSGIDNATMSRALIDTANFFQSPEGIGTAFIGAAPAAVRNIAGYLFAGMALKNAPETVRNWVNAKTETEKRQAGAQMIETGLMLTPLAEAGLHGRIPTEALKHTDAVPTDVLKEAAKEPSHPEVAEAARNELGKRAEQFYQDVQPVMSDFDGQTQDTIRGSIEKQGRGEDLSIPERQALQAERDLAATKAAANAPIVRPEPSTGTATTPAAGETARSPSAETTRLASDAQAVGATETAKALLSPAVETAERTGGSAKPQAAGEPVAGPALIEGTDIVHKGEIGKTHSMLINEAAIQGNDVTESIKGFHDAQGKPLTREEAAQRALDNGQIDQATFDKAMAREGTDASGQPLKGLHSEDLIKGGEPSAKEPDTTPSTVPDEQGKPPDTQAKGAAQEGDTRAQAAEALVSRLKTTVKNARNQVADAVADLREWDDSEIQQLREHLGVKSTNLKELAKAVLQKPELVETEKPRSYKDQPSKGGRTDALDILAKADAGEPVTVEDIFGNEGKKYQEALRDEMSDDPDVADKGQSEREKLEEDLPEDLKDILYGRAPMKRGRTGEAGFIPVPKPVAEVAKAAGEIAKKFAQEDVSPFVVEGAKNTAEAFRQIKNFVAPALADEYAKSTAGIIRQNAAELARSSEIAVRSLKKASDFFDRQSNATNLAVIDSIETGTSKGGPGIHGFEADIRKAFDERVDQIQALGTGKLEKVIQDYFPHIWKDPDAATNWYGRIFGRRPLEGPKSFLKQRTIPTTAEGIAQGLVPVSYNPVELSLLKLHEMDRYIMGQKVIAEMKEKGLAEFVSARSKPPDRYVKINDRVAQVIQFRPTIKADGTIGAPEMILRGHYYAPEGAARIINNYLSPGLRGIRVYDGIRWIGNVMNQAQLGLSAFHLGFVSVDSGVSKVALGLEHILEGRPLQGLAEVAQAPTAPIQNMIRGNKMLQEYYKPGSQSAQVAQMMDAAMKAGARASMDSFYRTDMWKNMTKAWRKGNVIGAALRAPFAAFELTMKPVLEYAVPRMKMGMFADLARSELERIGPTASLEEQRAVMAKAWDSVDNRMGQLVYDNLFWNKAFKDTLMAGTRSVGWNLGTIRELGGGAVDIAATPARIARSIRGDAKLGEKVVTHRMAYAMALPMVVGFLGAIYQYLHTGKLPGQNKDGTFGGDENALRDMMLPRTGKITAQGEEERAELPSYMKDVFAYSRHPGQTVANKAAPEIAMVNQMLNNKDYYGTQIRNPDDPLYKQAKDEAEFVAKSLIPFSIKGAKQRTDASPEGKAESFVGIIPAPAELTRTPAHQAMVDSIMSRVPQGARTKEDQQRRELQKAVVEAGKKGVPIQQALSDAAKQGAKFTPRQKQNIVKAVQQDPRQLMFSHLSVSEARKVYALSNQEEKKLFGRMLNLKELRAHEPLTPTTKR